VAARLPKQLQDWFISLTSEMVLEPINPGWIESPQYVGEADPFKSKREEKHMKKYVKPNLKTLGLLRVATKYSHDLVTYGNLPF
jgi:hypothetical protein